MKIVIAALLAVLASGCAHDDSYKSSQRSYAGDAGSVRLMYIDQKDNVLLGMQGNRFRSASIELIGANGTVNWKYVPQADEPAATAFIDIADMFQDANQHYVACTNSYPADRGGTLSSTVHVLNEFGELVSSSNVPPPANDYKGNVSIEKCWEANGRFFILGTIYGGTHFDQGKHPGTIYWLRTIDKQSNVAKDLIFASNMQQRANVTDSMTIDGIIFFISRNGVFGELVKVDANTGEITQRRVDGQARLVRRSNRINTVSLRNGQIEVNRFDSALKPIGTATMEFGRDNYLIAAYALATDRIAIVAASLGVGTSTLRVIETSDAQPSFRNVLTRRWTPAAVFSPTHAKDAKGRGVFQFMQFYERERRFEHAFFVLEKR